MTAWNDDDLHRPRPAKWPRRFRTICGVIVSVTPQSEELYEAVEARMEAIRMHTPTGKQEAIEAGVLVGGPGWREW